MRSIELGELKYVSDMTYMLFVSMEHPQIAKMSQCPQRKTIARHIKNNEDVHFYWCIMSAKWEDDTASKLLDMIVILWITIRSFSNTNGWLEKYKQMNKTAVEISKGIYNLHQVVSIILIIIILHDSFYKCYNIILYYICLYFCIKFEDVLAQLHNNFG